MSLMALLGFALAALIGLSLGVLGGGGSILTVPVFVYVLGYGAKPAIAMSLPVVGMTSAVGALRHWRAGNVNLRLALIFGIVAMLGAYLGARLAVFVSGAVQLGLLGAVMLAAAISMLRGRASASDAEHATTAHIELRTIGPMLVVGLGVGVLTGLVGIGGGFLIVPALVLLARVPMKQAIGTSLLVIAMNSASGFAGYLGQAVIPWDVLALFTTVAVGGILVGTHLIRYLTAGTLKRAFGVFLLAVGALMLYQNLGTVMSGRGQGVEEAARR